MAAVASIAIKVDEGGAEAAFNNLTDAINNLTNSLKNVKQSSSDASDQVVSDMGRSREAAALVSEELGVNIPRALRSILAETPGVGEALSLAFSGLTVIGFVEILGQIPSAIEKLITGFEDLIGYSKSLGPSITDANLAQKTLVESLVTTNDQVEKLQKGYALIGLTGPALLAAQQAQLNKELDDAQASLAEAQTKQQQLGAQSKQTKVIGSPLSTFANVPTDAAISAKDQLVGVDANVQLLNDHIKLLEQQIANAGKATADAFNKDNLEGIGELGQMASDASQHLQQITKDAQSAGLDGLDKIQDDWEKSTQAITDYLVKSGDVDRAAQAQSAVDKQRADALTAYYANESVLIQKATTDYYKSVSDENAKAAQLAEQTAAEQQQYAQQIVKMQEDAAVAMLPPWEQSYAKIEVDAQEAYAKIQEQVDQYKLTNEQAAEEIAAVNATEFGKMRDQIASDLESGFDAILDGTLLQKVEKMFEDMVFQMVATWVLGMNGIKSATQSTFSSAGSLFGFGGGSGSSAGILGAASSIIGPGGTAGIFGGDLFGGGGAIGGATAAALGIPIAGAGAGAGAGLPGITGTPGTVAAAQQSAGLAGLASQLFGLGGGFAFPALLAAGGASLLGSTNPALGGLGGFLTGGGIGLGLEAAGSALGIISPLLAFAGPIGAIAGLALGIFGAFGNGKKIEKQEEALEDQLKQQLQTIQNGYNVHGTDYADAINEAEQLRTQFTQAQNQVKSMSPQQQHDYVDQYVDATEAQINQIEAQRNAQATTIANLPLPEFRSGGFTPWSLPGGRLPAVLHEGEAVLNRTGRSVLGDDAISAANSGKSAGNNNTVHIHPGAIVVNARDGMDVRALAKEVTKHIRSDLANRGYRLGSPR